MKTSFFTGLFDNGDLTKVKLSAEQMVIRMQEHDVKGQKFYRPEELLLNCQIQTGRNRSRKKTKRRAVDEDSGIVAELNDFCEVLMNSSMD